MSFDETLSKLQNPDGDFEPSTIYSDLKKYHEDDLSSAAAKVADLENQLKESQAQISALKTKNYDLMINSPSTPEPVSNSDASDDIPKGIDDLFGKE
jgi:hypothetical protein